MRYPKAVKDFIAEHYKGRTVQELAELVNAEFGLSLTPAQMHSYKKNHKLKSGTPTGMRKGAATDTYPQNVRDYIAEHHRGIGPTEMAKLLNDKFGRRYTRAQIKSYYANHGISSGLTGRFEKGHVPATKGQKGLRIPGSEKGWFRPGHKPHNHMPVGTEMYKNDGYLWVKTDEGIRKWRQKHIIAWEEVHGPVPEGHVLIFKDKNHANTSIDNLALVTLAESLVMTRSGFRTEFPECTEAGLMVAKIKIARRELTKRFKKAKKRKSD